MARLHSATGSVPLLAFVGFHLWETSSATGGRERFAVRVTGTGGSWVIVLFEVALVLAPLTVHIVLGALRAGASRREPPHAGYADAGSRYLQWITGGLTLAFVVGHMAHTWVAKLGGAGPFELYEALRVDLPRPWYLGLYVVGLTALCLHIAQGVGAAAVTWSIARTERSRRGWRIGGGLLAVCLWLVAINTTSHFTTGGALLFREAPLVPSGAVEGAP
jgi:succinate dehydrogenase/fumarate reductase cytochrome b subunit (b558 family)